MTLSDDLEREHAKIDQRIESFTSALTAGQPPTTGLQEALDELRRHVYFEEELLFPPLAEAGLVPPLFVMRREHGEIWEAMDALSTGVRSEEPDVLAKLVSDLVARLNEHNMKEEMIVYPAAEQMIAAPIRDELSARLAEVSMPDGWVCEGAR